MKEYLDKQMMNIQHNWLEKELTTPEARSRESSKQDLHDVLKEDPNLRVSGLNPYSGASHINSGAIEDDE